MWNNLMQPIQNKAVCSNLNSAVYMYLRTWESRCTGSLLFLLGCTYLVVEVRTTFTEGVLEAADRVGKERLRVKCSIAAIVEMDSRIGWHLTEYLFYDPMVVHLTADFLVGELGPDALNDEAYQAGYSGSSTRCPIMNFDTTVVLGIGTGNSLARS